MNDKQKVQAIWKLQMAVNMRDWYNIGYFSKISHLETFCFVFLLYIFVGKKVNRYNAYGIAIQVFNIYTKLAVKIIPEGGQYQVKNLIFSNV